MKKNAEMTCKCPNEKCSKKTFSINLEKQIFEIFEITKKTTGLPNKILGMALLTTILA